MSYDVDYVEFKGVCPKCGGKRYAAYASNDWGQEKCFSVCLCSHEYRVKEVERSEGFEGWN